MRLSTLVLALFGNAAHAAAYALSNDPVHCHAGPSHDSGRVRTYDAGADVHVECQNIGPRASIWHRTSDGCYVPDVDVRTNDVVISRCADAGSEYYPADEL